MVVDVDSLKVAELRDELKKRDLNTAGLKKDLVARLKEALAAEEGTSNTTATTTTMATTTTPGADVPATDDTTPAASVSESQPSATTAAAATTTSVVQEQQQEEKTEEATQSDNTGNVASGPTAAGHKRTMETANPAGTAAAATDGGSEEPVRKKPKFQPITGPPKPAAAPMGYLLVDNVPASMSAVEITGWFRNRVTFEALFCDGQRVALTLPSASTNKAMHTLKGGRWPTGGKVRIRFGTAAESAMIKQGHLQIVTPGEQGTGGSRPDAGGTATAKPSDVSTEQANKKKEGIQEEEKDIDDGPCFQQTKTLPTLCWRPRSKDQVQRIRAEREAKRKK